MGDSARLCLFCLEKRTNRQKIFCVENLFSCECKVYCHAKCIKKWNHFCGDDLQCPICRRSIVEEHNQDEEEQLEIIREQIRERLQEQFQAERELAVIQLEIDERIENTKKIIALLIHLVSFLVVWRYVHSIFTYLPPS